MEIMDDVPDVDAVVVPIGGGGLIAGISCAIKTLKPETAVIGVEPEFCASYTAALKAGQPVPAPFTPTLADGLAVPVIDCSLVLSIFSDSWSLYDLFGSLVATGTGEVREINVANGVYFLVRGNTVEKVIR